MAVTPVEPPHATSYPIADRDVVVFRSPAERPVRAQCPFLFGGLSPSPEAAMNEDTFNMEIRKFLKLVGVTSQREIENAVHAALKEGKLKGNEKLAAQITLTLPAIGLSHRVDGEIELD
jgi:hypothetical protein